MAEIALKYVHALNQAIFRLYEPGILATLPERLFEVMALVAPGHLMHLSVTKPGVGAVDAFLTLPAQRELMTLIENRAELARMPGVVDHSFYLAAEAGPTSFHDLMSQETLEATILWQAFCKPLELEHDISINFCRSKDLFYTISSSRDGKAYSAEERQMLAWLQPHLRQRFQQLLAAEPNHPLGRPAPRDAVAPSLVVNSRGGVEYLSNTSRDLLARCGVRMSRQLPAKWREWLKEQLTPVLYAPPQPLLLALKGGTLEVHCLLNRHSDRHRLILDFRADARFALTQREREVTDWLVQGKTNRQIGEILGISPATVKVHVERVLAKLQVENRTAAVKAFRL